MTERARITAIDGGVATLECFEHQGCSKCGAAFCNVQARTYQATIPGGATVHVGDHVEVYVAPARAVGAAFSVLILPLILFAAGYIAFGFTESEPLRVAAGFGGLALGLLGVVVVSRRRRPALPQITAVLGHPSLEPFEIGS